MAAASRSALHVGGWIGELAMLVGTSLAAALGHVLIGLGIFLFSLLPMCNITPTAPPDVIEVSLVSMPKSDSAMAQMDVSVAPAPAPVDVDAPAPEDAPGLAEQGTSEPPPETASDLQFETADANEAQGDPNRERVDARTEAMNRLRREQALAALGSAESTAGDPDSTSTERIDLGGVGRSDPVFASHVDQVRRRLKQDFNPILSVAQNNPGIKAEINVRVNVETGAVQSWSWRKRSGNASWDGACERAVSAVSSVPVAPEKYRPIIAIDGYDVECDAQ